MNIQNRNVTIEDEVNFIFKEPEMLGKALEWWGISMALTELGFISEMHQCRMCDTRNRFDKAAFKLVDSLIPRVEMYVNRIRPAKETV